MRSPQIRVVVVAALLAVLASVDSLSAALVQPAMELTPPASTAAPRRSYQADPSASRVRSSFRQNATSRTQAVAVAVPPCEYKELMTNLHDRVGILATLDEDQRNRLEVIDKKLNQLVDSNAGRMESMKAQQLDFQKRLDSFEHIQRLSRNTLDELKDLTRLPRAAYAQRHDFQPTDETGYPAGLFTTDNVAAAAPMSRSKTQDIQLDVPQRLDALATLLASTAINVKDLQRNLSRIVQNTNNIQRRLGVHRRRGQQGPWQHNYPVSAQLPPAEPITSCLQSYAAINGILKVQLTAESDAFYVPCDGNGWTVVMNRYKGDVNFERSWLDYQEGFGNLAGEFFIGLDKLHALTAYSVNELRIILEDFEGNVTVADYSIFAIGSEKELYPLHLLGGLREGSTAGDSLSYHAGAKFSTFDHDNDNCVDCNCAQKHKGGWWYNYCATSNLHGKYYESNADYERAGESGVFWNSFRGVGYSLRSVKMLIRPVGQDEARR